MAENGNGQFGVWVNVRPKINKGDFTTELQQKIKSMDKSFVFTITPTIDPEVLRSNIKKAIKKMGAVDVPVNLKVAGTSKSGSNNDNKNALPNNLRAIDASNASGLNAAYKQLSLMGKNVSQFSITTKNIDNARQSFIALNKTTGETITMMRTLSKEGSSEWSYSVVQNANKGAAALAGMEKSAATLTNKIKLYMQQNTALSKKAPQVYDDLNALQQNLANMDFNDPNAKVLLTQYGSQFQELQAQAKNLGAEVDSLGHKFKETFTTRVRSIASVMLFGAMMSTLTTIKQNVVDIDSALTQLKIVTGESNNTLAKYFDDAADAAKRYGNSVTDIISSTETYARLGYSLNESLNLASVTNQFANVAAIDEGDATTSLTSILKAYNKDASEAERITDMLVKVGQDFAISASEIGVALENSGSALHVANTSLEESIALAAAGNASIQDASKVGNALKTLSAYIRGSKTDLKDLGEDVDSTVESTSKLEEKVSALTGGKVHLLEDDGQTYRSVYDVMLDIANVWDDMTDVNRASLLESIAGKRQATVVASIITNIKDLENAYQEAQDSEGTLAKATEIYLNSIQGKTDQFKAQFQELSAAILNSGLIKGIVGAGTGILSFLNTVGGKIVALGGIIAASPLFSPHLQSLMAVGNAINQVNSAITEYGINIAQLGGNPLAFQALSTAMEGLSRKQAEMVVSTLALNAEEKELLLTYFAEGNQLIVLNGLDEAHTLIIHGKNNAQKVANALGVEFEKIGRGEYSIRGQITKATIAQAIASGKLNEEQAQELLTLLALNKEQEKSAGLYAGLGKGLATFIKSPLGIAALVVAAIAAIAKITDVVLDKTNKSTDELSEDFSKTTQDLQSIENELSNVNSQLDELKNKQLSITDENDKKNLQDQIALLEQRKALLEREEEIRKNREQNEAKQIILATNDSSVYSGAAYGIDKGGKYTKANYFSSFGNAYSAQEFVNGLYDGSIETGNANLDDILKSLDEIYETYNLIASNDNLIGTEAYQTAIEQLEKINAIMAMINDKRNAFADAQNYALGSSQGMSKFFDSQSGSAQALINNAYDSGKTSLSVQDVEEYYEAAGKTGFLQNAQILYNVTLEDYVRILNLAISNNQTFTDVLNSTSSAADDVAGSISTLSNAIEELDAYAKGVQALDTAYGEMKESGEVSFDTLMDIQDAFSDVDGIDDYIKKLAGMKKGGEEFNKVLSDLVYAGVQKTLSDEEIVASGQAVIENLLRSKGVVNAEAVAKDILRQANDNLVKSNYEAVSAEASLAASNYDVGNSANWSAAQLANDANAANMTKGAFALLIAQQQIFSNSSLSVDNKIAALKRLYIAAGATASAIASLDNVKTAGKGRRYTNNPQDLEKKASNDLLSVKFDTSAFSTAVFTGGGGGKSGGSKSGGGSSKKSKEEIDWIEIKIDRIERKIKKFNDTAGNAFLTTAKRVSALNKELKNVNKEIDIQEKAAKKYGKKADSVNLSSALKKRVREGKIDINSYDDKTAEKIKKYQDYYEKKLAAIDKQEELLTRTREIAREKFERHQEDYENQIEVQDRVIKKYDILNDTREARGRFASAAYYQAQIDTQKMIKKIREKELTQLEKDFKNATDNKRVQKNSDEWYKMKDAIDEAKLAVKECDEEIANLNKSIMELDWEKFDWVTDRMGRLRDEAATLDDILSSYNLFNDNGRVTDKGMTSFGLKIQQYENYIAEENRLALKIAELNSSLQNDPFNKDVIDKRDEYIKQQQNMVKNAQDMKKSIQDLVKEGIEKELDALNKLIKAYTDSLDSAKDLFDYSKKIKDASKNVTDLKKQLSAYAGDTSEENKAKIQELREKLEESENSLQDIEYDRYVSDQKELLNDFYNQYESLLKASVEDIDKTLTDIKDVVNNNLPSINNSILDLANKFNFVLSDAAKTLSSSPSTSEATQNIQNSFTQSANEQAANELQSLTPSNNSPAPSSGGDGKLKKGDKVNVRKGTDIFGKDNLTDKLKNLSALLDNYEMKDADVLEVKTISSGKNKGKTAAKIKIKDSKGEYIKVGGKVATGWVNSARLSGFSSGGFIADTQKMAYKNGDDIVTINTLKKGEAVLTAQQAQQFSQLVDKLPILDSFTASMKKPAFSSLGKDSACVVDSNVVINIDIEKVEDYNDFKNQLIRDPQMEKFFRSVSIDLLAGKNSLSKNKYIN